MSRILPHQHRHSGSALTTRTTTAGKLERQPRHSKCSRCANNHAPRPVHPLAQSIIAKDGRRWLPGCCWASKIGRRPYRRVRCFISLGCPRRGSLRPPATSQKVHLRRLR
ncbi:hypothetical protein MAPG_06637 [Magnaporthiopsis poae ATCC 64411]|uniref:Uncharacterized protein n=1 Tax=Magnaporthiopsis poae (strain ATCC 64411 / 73-15) TaxID=644358 RepID=A0A0C4E2J7_MAGP6|nr:hypothetical protein MAPG_06637 [Magnaporthiopsis poae ATCC 64411]